MRGYVPQTQRSALGIARRATPAVRLLSRGPYSIRHFWSGELGAATADPGQDPRGSPKLDPLWAVLDTTPDGRGKDWYPRLAY